MRLMRKFLFERSFDRVEHEPSLPSKTPILTHALVSDEEKEALQKQGFESGYGQGFQDGLAAEKEKREALVVDLLEALSEKLKAQSEIFDQQKETLFKLASYMTVKILKKVFPAFSEHLSGFEVENFTTRVLKREKPNELRILSHPEHCLFLKEKLLKEVPYTSIVCEPDEDIALGDVRLLWGSVGVERIQEKILAECLAILGETDAPPAWHPASQVDHAHHTLNPDTLTLDNQPEPLCDDRKTKSS